MFSQQSRLCNSEFRSILFWRKLQNNSTLFSVSVFILLCLRVCVCVCVAQQANNFIGIQKMWKLLRDDCCSCCYCCCCRFESDKRGKYAAGVSSLPTLPPSTYYSHFFAKYQQSLKLMTLIIMSDTSIAIAVGPVSFSCFPRRCWAHSSQFNVCAFVRTIYFAVNKTI